MRSTPTSLIINIRLLESDRVYLDRFYDSIWNRKSSDLATEFAGFVYEKQAFYANLSDILEVKERWLINASKDISDAMAELNRRRNMASFDGDAVRLLTTPICLIKETAGQLRDYRSRNIR